MGDERGADDGEKRKHKKETENREGVKRISVGRDDGRDEGGDG